MKPCIGCGGSKEPGRRGYRYCTSCTNAKRLCQVCGERYCEPDRKTCSDECLREQRVFQAYHVIARRPPRQRVPLPPEKHCPNCGITKPLTVEHFTPQRRDPETGEILRFAGWCKPCKAEASKKAWAVRTPEQIERDRAYSRAMYELYRDDPAMRERNRERRRAWRQANPDKAAAASRRYQEKRRQDPERHALYLALQRIAYRLKREAEGHEVTRAMPALDGWFASAGNYADLDIEPLAVWLEEALDQDERDKTSVSEAINVNERILSRILRREHYKVSLGLADKLLWSYDIPVRIRSESVQRRLEAWARDLPGNGTRLLRYLDRAERVAHMADASVRFVEDLWPHLDDE